MDDMGASWRVRCGGRASKILNTRWVGGEEIEVKQSIQLLGCVEVALVVILRSQLGIVLSLSSIRAAKGNGFTAPLVLYR
jgi:hypothetical protein